MANINLQFLGQGEALPPSVSQAARRVARAIGPFWSYGWRALLLLSVFRLGLVAWQWDRVDAAGTFAFILMQGLRFDIVLLGLLFAAPVLMFPLLASNRWLLPGWRWVVRIYFPVALLVALFLECATPSFIAQFDSRPNILFVEYLNHPVEIASTLWVAYKLQLLLAGIALFVCARIAARLGRRLVQNLQPVGILPALLVTPLLLILCVAAIRSTLDHRPVNPSTVAKSSDPMVNDLALSSLYTTLYAIYEMGDEPDGGFRYADMDPATAIGEVRGAMGLPPSAFTSKKIPTLHRQVATRDERRNLVIVLEESLGAEFVGSLGGRDLTPNLDRLADDGMWFENLYATGTRSVRGIEAVVTGFTPTPARSVVKLGGAQRNFFTLAQLLRQHGYRTQFIYGGESQFDNMRRFFMNNGFDSVIDKKDYENAVFTGSWGVSDEDLFAKAHDSLSETSEQPTFSLVFTSSNHSPYEFPDGRIELADQDNKNTVNNAVKYADHALGTFIQRARQSGYWDDTVFLIVADHNSRVYGAELVPIERFHIPGLILGGSIAPSTYSPVASQIDLAPTLLSLIGVSSSHPMIGRDLTRPEFRQLPGRAIMQYNARQAYLQDDEVVILQKDQPAAGFRYVNRHLEPLAKPDDDLLRRALAHATWTSHAYAESRYRLPAGD